MRRDKYKHRPGPGWTRAGVATVFDHVSGLRVHTHGACWLPDGSWVSGQVWPEISSLNWFVLVNGGNRRRGVMAWALQLLNNAKKARVE